MCECTNVHLRCDRVYVCLKLCLRVCMRVRVCVCASRWAAARVVAIARGRKYLVQYADGEVSKNRRGRMAPTHQHTTSKIAARSWRHTHTLILSPDPRADQQS